MSLLRATVVIVLVGCSGTPTPGDPADSGNPEAQLPPTSGATALQAWLAKGYYKSWHCEGTKHDARPPSPHNVNRICNNEKITSQPAGPGEYPVGAAAVKELYTP